MSYEEMLDFPMIQCESAAAAKMPTPSRGPAFGRVLASGFLDDLSDVERLQRGIMLDGLWFRAKRYANNIRHLAEWDARYSGPIEIVEAERPE